MIQFITEYLRNHPPVLNQNQNEFIARYGYTYNESVFMTEASAVKQNDSDRIKNR